MPKKRDPILSSMTIEEASEFWDNHSVADYPTRVVQMHYAPEGQTTFVAVANDILGLLEKRAKQRGVSVETLVNLWLQEKLAT
jgi:hypothetical protein